MTIKTMSYKTTKKDYTLILKITSHNQIVTIITLSVLDVVHFRNAKALTAYNNSDVPSQLARPMQLGRRATAVKFGRYRKLKNIFTSF